MKWSGPGKDWRELIIAVTAGLVVWAVPQAISGVSPAIHALIAPIVALPWYVTLPSLMLIASGAMNICQSVAAIRRHRELTAEAIVKIDPRWLEIDLRSIAPVALMRSSMTPQLWIFPRLTNFGPIALRVTHLTVRVSFGQIFQKLMLDTPFTLQPLASKTDVCLSAVLDKDTAEKIAGYVAAQADFNMIYLDVGIACESKGGSFEKSTHVERQPRDIGEIVR